MTLSKANTFLSTFNLFLILVGYQLVTSIFLPSASNYDGREEGLIVARTVTVPYKVFALLTALGVIALNWGRRIRLNLPLKLYFIFWLLLILRILYDLEVRTDVILDAVNGRDTLVHLFFVCIIPSIAVWRSLPSIDYEWAFKLVFAGYVILIPIFYFNNPWVFTILDVGQRVGGNIGMSSIVFGHYGVSLVLLAFYHQVQSHNLWLKVSCYVLMIIGAFVMLRSGSRGPLMALIGGFLFYYVARRQSKTLTICILCTVVFLSVLLGDIIFDVIQKASPVMARRITLSGNASQYEELTAGRGGLYEIAINKFLDHPILGDTFAITYPDGYFIYSHNIILDAFMGLGLFGGILFLCIVGITVWRAFKMISLTDSRWWVAILFIQFLIYHQFSGCFYKADALNALMVIVMYKTSLITLNESLR